MPRYSRLPNGPQLDIEADADSVALMQGPSIPRKYGDGSTEYVPLDDLDENGRPTNDGATDHIIERMQSSSRRLLWVVLGIGILLVCGGVVGSAYQRTHTTRTPPGNLLLRPLPREPLSNGTHSFNRTTLVISIDGMHPHYVSKMRTPRLHDFVLQGCAAPYMEPSFPTQTFPNHWTLVTGQYPINHGIIGNTFYDPEIDLEFVNTDPAKSMDTRFWGGEPIWVTAAKQGLKTAVHMWPGSEVDWKEGAPDASKFDPAEPLDKKADKILSWLDQAAIPDIMLAYVPDIDTVGHQHGINGLELITACMNVDNFVGSILDGLNHRNLTHVVNLVIVSDHGMAPTSDQRLAFLDDVVSNWENVTSNRGWPLAGLRFDSDAQLEEAYSSAHDRSLIDHAFRAFKSEDMPRRWKFTTAALNSLDPDRPEGPGNDYGKRASSDGEEPVFGTYKHRLAPMYLVPEVGWSLLTHDSYDEMGNHYNLSGVHGYDNRAPIMRALFAAQGPAFPSGKYHPFPNVDLYSAICRSVGIRESENSEGDFALWPLAEEVKEVYPGVDFTTPIMAGSTFETF